MEQASLFNKEKKGISKTGTKGIARFFGSVFVSPPTPDDALCDVFICTLKNGRTKTLFRMYVGDAKKLCSHEATKGKHFADEWMLLFSSEELIPFETNDWQKNDGRFDELIEELGCEIIYKKV